jgi:hypothetical protein
MSDSGLGNRVRRPGFPNRIQPKWFCLTIVMTLTSTEIKRVVKCREIPMKSVQHYRAMASICRQRAVFDPQHSWKHLGDAERWEHLAHAEIADRFEECNAAVGAPTGASPSSASKDTSWDTDAAA